MVVPSQAVPIGGQDEIGWWEINPNTGDTVGVLQDGTNGIDEYGDLLGNLINTITSSEFWEGFFAAFLGRSLESVTIQVLKIAILTPWVAATGGAAATYSAIKNSFNTANQLQNLPIGPPLFQAGFKAGLAASFFLVADPA